MRLLEVPIRRPVATSMFFLAIVLLGLVGTVRLPVELFPDLEGDRLFVDFFRPGGEPLVVERELLMPLEGRVAELPLVAETWGEVRGSGGRFQVRFERGSDLKVRELEVRRIAAELAREQPRGTFVEVRGENTSVMSRFAMIVHVTGAGERDTLHDLVEDQVAPKLRSLPGVGQVLVAGGAPRQVTVWVDPDRCSALGVTTRQVREAVSRSVQRLSFLGGLEEGTGRAAVVLDGRPKGVISLGETRIVAERPVLLRHVAEVEMGAGRQEMLFRVNGRPAVGLIVFQEDGANLVRLGRRLRREMVELGQEIGPLGLDLQLGFDAAAMVEEQIDRLRRLALSGFAIALLVLYLFLRQWRAVAVVAVAVPVSLLAALALLYLGGQSLNLITLFGLAVAVGLLVDNSVVVFESVQRQLEHGAEAEAAAAGGVRRTARAIVAASVTTAIVFLPLALISWDEALLQSLFEVVALAILLPLAGSLLVAVGLVPLLARHLAAPAAIRRLAERRSRRQELGGLVPPDRAKALFAGLVTAALRRPPALFVIVGVSVLVTVIIALPWVAVNTSSASPAEGDEIQVAVRLSGGSGSLPAARGAFERLERAVLDLEGVEQVESMVREEGGSLTVRLVPEGQRPDDLSAARVRQEMQRAAQQLQGVEILRPGEGGVGGGGDRGGVELLLGTGSAEVTLSGPESATLSQLAQEIQDRLESMTEIGRAWPSVREGPAEIQITPDRGAFEAFGLTLDQVLPVLDLAGREGSRLGTGFTLPNGRELPVVLRRKEADSGLAMASLSRLRVSTPNGALPVAALASVRRMPPPPTIVHHNGRREMRVLYSPSEHLPETGPARVRAEERIAAAVRSVHRPRGYTVEAEGGEERTSWFRRLLVPVVLLLYLVLAVVFESLTLPLLVLLSLPLTLLGAVWALVLAGLPLDNMALLGGLCLFGLTVNPAILLVDRMQGRVRSGGSGGGGWSAGAAALAAVRERVRPVLMTTATTVAGLWPLALVTGQENEIWPPFATIVMGGLVTSTLLTLLVVPVGFIFLRRLDRVFTRVGPWAVLAWLASTTAIMVFLILSGAISSLVWQVITTLLVGGGLLAGSLLLLPRPETVEPAVPIVLEARCLRKVYGLPGPIGRAWRVPETFARKVLAEGGVAFDPQRSRELLPALLLVAVGIGYLAMSVQSKFWTLLLLLATAFLLGRIALEVRRSRGLADRLGRVRSGGLEGLLAAGLPWMALFLFTWFEWLQPRLAEARPAVSPWALLIAALLLALVQFGRRTAKRLATGELEEHPRAGLLRGPRTLWRRTARRVFGLDLPRDEVLALAGLNVHLEAGMIGVLGPNGAGKTTLLRQLAGILDPTRGRVTLGGVPLVELRRHLARWVGYLPQDAGLPPNLTAREYLTYYATLYDLPATERQARVERLLQEVGLAERADERIGSFSGGMRQRVAVARTLLRLPPVIIVDEPTVGLDPRERIRFRNLLVQLARERIVLFSTHVVEDVAVACDRTLVLIGGRKVFDGPPVELARLAEGVVWEATLSADEEAELPSEVTIADQIPAANGRSSFRLLAKLRPHRLAEAATPTLEDGYLVLAGRAGV